MHKYKKFASLGLLMIASLQAQAEKKFEYNETVWASLGAGVRSSFRAQEDRPVNDWDTRANLDNFRMYLNAQVHKYFKIEVNSECASCGNGGDIQLLDAIGKFEVHPLANVWVGRHLVPAERRELNGPFYSAVYNIFQAGTPFEPADFNTVIKDGGVSAGSLGRDDGVTFWGAAFEGRFQYAAGFFYGLRGGANRNDDPLYAQRFAYNFWNVEKNPGYYTSGTYYGKGGDILTLAVSNQYQENGAGTATDAGNFRGTAVDLLLEKNLPNSGVVTFNGEYKNYDITDGYSMASRIAGGGFAMFEGNAVDVSGMYLFPEKILVGQVQPFVRYVDVAPTASTNRDVYEAGINYIIDGHNAKISMSYQYGDLMTKGLNYTPNANGDKVNAMNVNLQWQI